MSSAVLTITVISSSGINFRGPGSAWACLFRPTGGSCPHLPEQFPSKRYHCDRKYYKDRNAQQYRNKGFSKKEYRRASTAYVSGFAYTSTISQPGRFAIGKNAPLNKTRGIVRKLMTIWNPSWLSIFEAIAIQDQ